MKKITLTLAVAFTITSVAYAQDSNEEVQENFATHNSALGETVLVIAKKYKITPRDIYDYNPDAIQGISENTVLRIPLHRQYKPKTEVATASYADEMYGYSAPKPGEKKAPETTVADINEPLAVEQNIKPHVMQTLQHTVQSGETLYSLSRKYNTTVQAIEKENSDKLGKGLEAGTVLNITTIPREGDPTKYVTHAVASGETLFSLAKKYGTTVESITESNRVTLKKGLMSGQQLYILPGNVNGEVQGKGYEIAKADVVNQNTVEHTVQNGDTLMGLAQKYHTTVDDITAANRSKVNNGSVKAGQVLTIRNNSTALSTVAE